MTDTISDMAQLVAENARLAEDNALLRSTIELQKRQMRGGATVDERVRRLRARLPSGRTVCRASTAATITGRGSSSPTWMMKNSRNK